jgi:hypothetical protein
MRGVSQLGLRHDAFLGLVCGLDPMLIEVRPEPAAFMSEHKFKVGQWVTYGPPPGQRRIVYTILQQLPFESGGEPRYRVWTAVTWFLSGTTAIAPWH